MSDELSTRDVAAVALLRSLGIHDLEVLARRAGVSRNELKAILRHPSYRACRAVATRRPFEELARVAWHEALHPD